MEDLEYLRTRLRVESEAARTSPQERVKLRHLELAAAYEFRIHSILRVSTMQEPFAAAIRA